MKVISAIGIFWMPIVAWFGCEAWEHRPAGWPNWTIDAGPIHIPVHFPDGPYARLDALKAAAKQAHDQAQAVNAAEAKVSSEAEKHEAQAQAQIRTVYRTIYKEIPSAITPAVDRAYPLPNGFVRLYNASVSGVPPVPASPGEPDDAPSPIALSEAAGAILNNDAECLADRQRLIDLQGWVTNAATAASVAHKTPAAGPKSE